MFHFNTVTRVECYDHGVLDTQVGYDGCFDCTAELDILYGYTRSVHYRGRRQGREAAESSAGPGPQADSPPVEEDERPVEIAAEEPEKQDAETESPQGSPDQPPLNSPPVDDSSQPVQGSPGTAVAPEIPRTPWAELTPEDKKLVLELGAQISLDLGRKWRALCTPQPPPDHREFLNTFLRFGRNA